MKRVIICLILCIFTAGSQAFAKSTDITIETSGLTFDKWTFPPVTAHSAILLDAETGDIFYQRDAYQKRPPASTTKILTAILAIETAGFNETAVVSEKAGMVGESSLYLSKGNMLKLGELIEGALLKSGNDACVAIAEQTAGSEEEFVNLMNQKALALGAQQSHFTNTNGLPDKDHYSTAYDLALIARYAMQNPIFAQIVNEKFSNIDYIQPSKSQVVKNTNKLLWNYPLADGIKTGTTTAAGKCLIASASKAGRRLICVVLDAPDRFGDAQRLLQWGFDHTERILLAGKGEVITGYSGLGRDIPAVLAEDISFCQAKGSLENLRIETIFKRGISAPVKKGDVLGSCLVWQGERLCRKVPLLAGQDYQGGLPALPGRLRNMLDQYLDLSRN